MDEPAQAADNFEKTMLKDPVVAESHKKLGRALETEGKRQNVLAAYRRAVQLRDSCTEAVIAL
ncbi:MAG: hypothetical protein EOO40_04235 [Deltaproteobacteria bacterium]|nr:MAG: hypothetical protein EOO40_04235 [Deltaproteobacteria bacterium]